MITAETMDQWVCLSSPYSEGLPVLIKALAAEHSSTKGVKQPANIRLRSSWDFVLR